MEELLVTKVLQHANGLIPFQRPIHVSSAAHSKLWIEHGNTATVLTMLIGHASPIAMQLIQCESIFPVHCTEYLD